MVKKRKGRRSVKISRKLSDFLKDESGSMSKENILKIGIATIAALGSFTGTVKAADRSGPQDAGESAMTIPDYGGANSKVGDHMAHTNADVIKWSPSAGGQKYLYPSHVHHAIHESY